MMTGINWDDEGNYGGLLNSRSSRECLSEREVEDFLFDRLSGVTREVVEEHLLVCQSCLQKVEAEEDYVRTMREAARTLESEQLERAFQVQEPAKRKRLRLPGWQGWGMVLAATAAVVVALFLQFRQAPILTEAEIALRLERSAGELVAEAVANQPLRLTPDLTGLPAASELEWAVVNAVGASVTQASFGPVPGTPQIKLPRGLKAGTYWVRIQKPGAGLLREFALRVR